MKISNEKKSMISYTHKNEIQNVFKKYIKGELFIDHFSLNIFFANKENIFLSPTPAMAEELCKKNFVNFDSNYKKEIYTLYKVYPWKAVERNNMDKVINHVKEEKFNMRNGMMLIRNLGDNRYAMYSFATRKKDNFPGQFYFLYYSKANYIAEMGDFMYNQLLPIINQYAVSEKSNMPEIKNFSPIILESELEDDSKHKTFYDIKNGENKVKFLNKKWDFLNILQPKI